MPVLINFQDGHEAKSENKSSKMNISKLFPQSMQRKLIDSHLIQNKEESVVNYQEIVD